MWTHHIVRHRARRARRGTRRVGRLRWLARGAIDIAGAPDDVDGVADWLNGAAGIAIVDPPIGLERWSRRMVEQLGTLVPHTVSAVPLRMPIVPSHTSVKSLSDAAVGTVGAAVAVRIALVRRVMSPVPLAIAVAPLLATLVHPANAFVEPTMPRVPMPMRW